MSPSFQRKDFKAIVRQYFNELDDPIIEDILNIGHVVEYNSKEYIMKQGDLSTDVFLLLTGRLLVRVDDGYGKPIDVNEINSGEFFGEMAVFTQEPRSTSIVCTRHSTLLKINGEDFENMLDTHASVVKVLGKTIIRRLKESNQATKKWAVNKNLLLLPISQDYDIDSFSNQLKDSLSKFGKVLLVDEKLFQDLNLSESSEDISTKQKQFNYWLYSQDESYDFILFSVKNEISDFSKIALGQSDSILLVGNPNDTNQYSEFEQKHIHEAEIDQLVEVSLLADHRGNEGLESVKHLTVNRRVKKVLHIDTDRDFNKVSRILSGHAIKLVLGGGGAKGFAHLGVFKAMLELDIPIDMVAGTSVGAIMASAIAMGWDYKKAEEVIHYSMVEAKPMNKYHFPFISIISNSKLEKVIKEVLGDVDITDLRIPFLAVSANLSKMSTQIMDKGLTRKAVLASIAIPSVLPPQVHENSLLLDGGIVDNLPYEPIQKLAQGPTIGVDLSFIKERELGYEQVPGSWDIFKGKFLGGKKYKVPGIHQIIMGTMTLASNEKRLKNKDKFDVYIQPEVSKFGFLKWNKFHPIIDAGYTASYEVLKKWKEENKHLL